MNNKIRGLPLHELFNSITHGLGILMSIAALVLLLFFSLNQKEPDSINIVAYAVYGTSLVLLYTASTLYHSVTDPQKKKILNVLDHSAIFILIAGTYTPFTLVSLRGPWGWSVFWVIWGLALAGVIFKLFFYTDKLRKLSAAIYILMGWIMIVAIRPLIDAVPTGGLLWLVAGGLFYCLGVYFYIRRKNPWNHVIWHFFVLAGSISHFFAVFFYVLPA